MEMNFSLRFGGARDAAVQAASGMDTEGTSGVSRPSTWFTTLMGGGKTASGVRVTQDTALTISTVYRCLNVVCGTVGMLPLTLYKRTDSGREKAVDHPLYKLLKLKPNRRQTAYNWKRTMQAHVSMRGNGFSLIERDSKGVIQSLELVPSALVTVKRNPELGELFYDIQGGEQNIPARRMLHIRGFGFDGDVGLSTIEAARETMGLTLAMESAGSEAFSKGALPQTIISVKGNPDSAQRKKYRDDYVELYRGDRYAPAVIGEQVKIDQLKISLEDMQFLASRKHQAVEVCRWYGVPPHKVYELDRATFSNIEHQGIEWLGDSMDPQLINWEQQLNASLLTPDEQDEYYFEFSREALLRTDLKTRYEAYKIGREGGWLSVNDICLAENKAKVEGGDMRMQPLNHVPLGTKPKEAP